MPPEQATDRKNHGSGGTVPPEPCAFRWQWRSTAVRHALVLGGEAITPDSMDLPLHLELPGFRIQVIPLEGADHTPAQAGGQLGEKVPPHLVLLNGLQKGAQLFPIQNLLWEVIGL